MLFLTCTMISSVDLAHCGVSRATDLWIVIQLIHKSVLLYLMFGLYVCNLCFMRGKRKTGFSERATLLNEFDFLTYLVSLQLATVGIKITILSHYFLKETVYIFRQSNRDILISIYFFN